MLVGTSLYSLDVDGAPLSEVLRLHLLSSGARRLSCHARSDLQQRGGYTSHDNPALEFCHGEASIMDALRRASIFQLSPGMEWSALIYLLITSASLLLHTARVANVYRFCRVCVSVRPGCLSSLFTYLVLADVNALLGEKLKLVTVLIHQLLTTTEARNWIDECAKKLVTTQRHLRCHQMTEQRRSRDETQFWLVVAGSCCCCCFNIFW